MSSMFDEARDEAEKAEQENPGPGQQADKFAEEKLGGGGTGQNQGRDLDQTPGQGQGDERAAQHGTNQDQGSAGGYDVEEQGGYDPNQQGGSPDGDQQGQ
jgi:hypothetical protein